MRRNRRDGGPPKKEGDSAGGCTSRGDGSSGLENEQYLEMGSGGHQSLTRKLCEGHGLGMGGGVTAYRKNLQRRIGILLLRRELVAYQRVVWIA